jgi:hypothetical protein
VDASEHESHLRAYGLVEEGQVLDRLLVASPLSVDALAAAETESLVLSSL